MEYNVDYDVVKKPGKDKPLTRKESIEWMKCADDPFYFITNYCKVASPVGEILFEPRDYQKEIIETILNNRHVLLNAPRQVGKSQVMALLVLHKAIFETSVVSGVSSYSIASMQDIMDKVKFSYENLPDFLKPAVTIYNQKTIRFTNRSVIFGQVISEKLFRGKTITGYAIIDEAAFPSEEVMRDAYAAFAPAVEAAGKLSTAKIIMPSTPRGTTGLWADKVFAAMNNQSNYVYLKVDPSRIPNRDEEFKQSMIKEHGLLKYLQEFEGHFISSSPILVNSMVLESIKPVEPVSVYDDLIEVYVNSFRGRSVAVACDVAEGVNLDYSVIQVVDVDTFEQIAEYACNVKSQSEFVKDLYKLLELMYKDGVDQVYLTWENNGIGAGVSRLIESSTNKYLEQTTIISDVNKDGVPTGKSGLSTTHSSKLAGCGDLKDLIESKKLVIRSQKLLNELRRFTKKGTSFEAEKGANDDRVMAMIVMMNMLKQVANYEDNVHDVIHEIDTTDEECWGIAF